MSESDTLYQVRVESLEQIERGRDNVLRCRLHDATGPVPPTSGTVSVYDRAGTAIVSAAAVTVAGGEARYTLLAATTTSLTREVGWRVEWSLLMPDGTYRYPRRDAALVTTRLYPPATLADVYRRVSAVDPSSPRTLTGDRTADEMAGYLTDAWLEIEDRLLGSGRLPWLVLSPQALRTPLILGTIALIYEDLASRGRPELVALAQTYRTQARDALTSVDLTVAASDDTLTEPDHESVDATLFLCAR